MGQFGTGHSGGRQRPQTLLTIGQLASIAPSESWDGTAGSGFVTTPVDPARTTAKPALRLIEPPSQHFTNSLVVGVAAFANDNGTLIGGVDRVRFEFEGNSVDVVEPSLRTFADANGVSRTYFGYWVKLRRSASQTGTGQLFATAIPADATMKSRVIGPYDFTSTSVLHDFEIEVAATQTEIAGARYQSIGEAIKFLADQGADNPLITITEAGTYSPARPPLHFTKYDGGSGRCTVQATVPVTISYPGFTSDGGGTVRLFYDKLTLRGQNITIDARFISQITWEFPGGEPWFDGINVEISGTGRQELWRAGPRPFGHFAKDGGYWTECSVKHISDPFLRCPLVRGCVVEGGYRDVFTDAECVIGCTVHDWTAKHDWALDVDALSVSGPAGSTLGLSGGNDAANRTFTAKESGSSVSTFAVGRLEGYFTGSTGDGYTVQDVADWINGLPGWSATVLSNDRRASALSVVGQKGTWPGDVDVSAGTTFSTYFDQHGDFYQHLVSGPGENVIVADTIGYDMWAQNIFLTAGNPKDFVFVNCAFHNDPASGNVSNLRGDLSHVVIAHVTSATQSLNRQTQTNLDVDAYCLVANCAFPAVVEAVGELDEDLVIADLLLDDGAGSPTGSTGTVTLGTAESKIVGSITGDFTPAGELLTTLRQPVAQFDRSGSPREELAPVGAFVGPSGP